jgi:hypothetical protein
VRVDGRALAYAAAVESGLAVLALHGGPHGTLGALPWMMQLPGILAILFIPGERLFWGRVAVMLLVQLGLWYVLFAALRRSRRALPP